MDRTMPSRTNRRKRAPLVAALLGTLVALGLPSSGRAEPNDPARRYAGRARVYEHLSPESLEAVTTPARIKAVTAGNVAPMEIWRALEHGEKVECLDCIPHVAKLLYSSHPKTREISAWWLRRRIFGVFGPGEVYSQVVQTLSSDPSAERRAQAAEALGEFLVRPGVTHVATALRQDASPLVREASARALERLNSEGPAGELGAAIARDGEDERVVLSALKAATRINVFTGMDAVVSQIDHPSARVRKRAAEVVGALRARDAVVGLVAITSAETEPDAGVRAAAVAALGQIGDPSTRAAVEAALDDANGFVRDAAAIALRRL